MKTIFQLTFKGLAAVLPITLTIYICYWVVVSLEIFIRDLLMHVLPEEHYWKGMGLLLGLVLLFCIGALLNTWGIRSLFRWGERLLERIPLVKSVYTSLRDFMSLVRETSGDKKMQRVVSVCLDENVHLIGFIINEDLADLPSPLGDGADLVAVYLPLSYQIGGYTVYMPRSKVTLMDWSMEEAMRFTVTAGVTQERTGAV